MPHGTRKRKRALLLVRTPFQAWLAQKVIEEEGVTKMDLLYFTQEASSEDVFYFDRLKKQASRSAFIHVDRQKWDVLNHFYFWLKSRGFVHDFSYDLTLLSSIDSYVLNAFANRHGRGQLVTFDDGTANFNQTGVYFSDSSSRRARFYRYLFRSNPVTKTRAEIARHYTIQPAFGNIVEKDRLIPLRGWDCDNTSKKQNARPRRYFIGAPFSEVFNPDQTCQLETYAKKQGIDIYVRHPRERTPLNIGVQFLDKKGLIAEEAILADAGERPIELVGTLSSVIFNLAARSSKRTVIAPSGISRYRPLIKLARGIGCEIVFLDQYG